jgi:4-hydroxy-2-oxoheptanedioate aldolase
VLPDRLDTRLATSDPLLGAWTFLREPLAAETASRAGYDYVCIDAQHGLHDEHSVVTHLQAIATGGQAFPIVRVLWNEAGLIGRALDAGALGVIVPLINTVEDAQAVVHACRYPPAGNRSLGPIGAGARYGPRYVAEANDHVAPIPMIETSEALEQVDAIAAVPGVAALYVGPVDLSLSLGLPPRVDHEDELFDSALKRIVAACDAAGIIPAVHADPTLVAKRKAQGFRMITVGYDLQPMVGGLHEALATGRRG